MDDLVSDMLNKGLVSVSKEYQPVNREFIATSQQVTAWKFLDGDFADFQVWKSSQILTDIKVSRN